MTVKEAINHGPEVTFEPVPSSVLLQEGIMTPQQRRERLHFETNYHQARGAMKQAEGKERRLHQLVYVSTTQVVLIALRSIYTKVDVESGRWSTGMHSSWAMTSWARTTRRIRHRDGVESPSSQTS